MNTPEEGARVTPDEPSKGILDFDRALKRFDLYRYPPAPDLHPWIESYWVVTWVLPEGQEHHQTNLSHVSINVAIEPDGAYVYGVPGRTFVRGLKGRGRVFGVKFRPGGFHPFHARSLHTLTGRRFRLGILGPQAVAWAEAMNAEPDDAHRVCRADAFWSGMRPAQPKRAGPTLATLTAERIAADRSIVSVERAARFAGVEVRTLQRVFRREVGVTPKEVIRRFRLQEAAERLTRQPELTCAELALELGYYDQAHFIRDFRATVGMPPDTYRKRQARDPDRA